MAKKTPHRIKAKIAAKPKPAVRAKAKAARTPARGSLPAKKVKPSKRWTEAEIVEAFRRFQKAHPAPRGELLHVNPFTLLVAVVLSAQATDAGVNKATPALFALADTPEKMV